MCLLGPHILILLYVQAVFDKEMIGLGEIVYLLKQSEV